MTPQAAPLQVLPPPSAVDSDQWLPAPELAAARYIDREISNAATTSALCTAVAGRARSEGRSLVAGVLGELAAEFSEEVERLAPASVPELKWPGRGMWQVESGAGLDQWIQTVSDSLRHSERSLRWIAKRPDLPALAKVAFDALATARRARLHLLLACSAVDARCLVEQDVAV